MTADILRPFMDTPDSRTSERLLDRKRPKRRWRQQIVRAIVAFMLAVLAITPTAFTAGGAPLQDIEDESLADRPISEVRLEGLAPSSSWNLLFRDLPDAD